MKYYIFFLSIATLIAFSCSLPINRRILKVIEQQPLEEQFKLWHYALKRPCGISSEEGQKRFSIFTKNVKIIKDHNEMDLSYKLGLGPFSDLSFDEIKENFYDSSFSEEQIIENQKNFKNSLENNLFFDNDGNYEEIKSIYPEEDRKSVV